MRATAKNLTMLAMFLCAAIMLAAPASALEYTIGPPDGPDYGIPTSIEVAYTADGGAMKNEDLSKNAARIPPAFGSPSADALGTEKALVTRHRQKIDARCLHVDRK